MKIKYNLLLLYDDKTIDLNVERDMFITIEQDEIINICKNNHCYIYFSTNKKTTNRAIRLDYYKNKINESEWGDYKLSIIDYNENVFVLDFFKFKKFVLFIILELMAKI